MKKIMFILLLLVMLLTGCTSQLEGGSYYELPDLNGYTLSEIEELFISRERSYKIIFDTVEDELLEFQFIMYEDRNIGDMVNSKEEIVIVVFPEYTKERTKIILPDLTGYGLEDIEEYFTPYGMTVSVTYWPDLVEEKQGEFYSYAYGFEAGDVFYLKERISIVLYKFKEDLSMYYFPVETVYDGPYLDESFSNINYLDPRGGYFDVTLKYCGDGDTAVFNYPQDVYDSITSSAKSTRFLNMDTEETYSGGEEEWGKPGSIYTCGLLKEAEEIILQTDPGDSLLGTYGRLLAWVWIKLPGEDEFFLLNYMVVKQGLAQVKYEFGAGTTIFYGEYSYNQWMHIAEDYATDHSLGQWGNLLDYYWDYENNQPNFYRWNNE